MKPAFLPTRRALLQDLTERIRAIEARPGASEAAFPLGIAGLESCFPDGQLAAGSLVEMIAAAEGGGAWTLALVIAQRVCGEHKTLVIVDAQGFFYPPAAATWGVDLERCIVVRAISAREATAVLRQALDCRAVGAAIGAFDRLTTSECRRLQLACEQGGGVGLLLRPPEALHTPSFASVRWRVSPVATRMLPRRVRIEVVRCRGGKGGQSVFLEIDDETGIVRVPAGVGPAATGNRQRRASG